MKIKINQLCGLRAGVAVPEDPELFPEKVVLTISQEIVYDLQMFDCLNYW